VKGRRPHRRALRTIRGCSSGLARVASTALPPSALRPPAQPLIHMEQT
jgi:hypothetical protein